MITLTYLSDARTRFTREDLYRLLESCRRQNEASDITGMLLFAKGHFVQTLEGPDEEVEATFQRIAADRRHGNIVTAHRGDITTRSFADWSMGFRRLDDQQADAIAGLNDFFDPTSELYSSTSAMGRAGIFHRIFRDTSSNLPDDGNV